MTIGFRFRNPDTGQVVLSSGSLGILLLDQFQVAAGADVTTNYAGMAGQIQVMQFGSTRIGSLATITVTAVGGDASVRVRSISATWITVTRE